MIKQLLLLSNLLLTHAFVNIIQCNNILYCTKLNSRLYNNRLKYTISEIQRTTNIQVSLESEFEDIKKIFLNNQETNNNQENKEDNLVIFKTNQLSLLNNIATAEWSRTWIYDMVNINNESFPQYMYKDMFTMRNYCSNNEKNIDFYIGFFPTLRKCNNGPYYIGAFKLNPQSKIFSSKLIIQNPNYLDDDQSFLKEFKNILKVMCKRAGAVFHYSDLKNIQNKRYYMAWKYNIEI